MSKLFYTDKSSAKWELKKVKFDLAKQCVAFVISFVTRWVHFNYYIVFICTQLMHLIFIVFTKEDRICGTKNKKKKILFIVTWLELSISYTGEFSVSEFSAGKFSGYHFQYGPTWQRTVRMKLFFKVMWVSGNYCSLYKIQTFI